MALTKASLIDINGQELILDADADTSITADTDDRIDLRVAGSDVGQLGVNYFNLQGQTGTSMEVKLSTSDGSVGGYLYGEATEIGFLDKDGHWAIRHDGDNFTSFAINNSEKMRLASNGNLTLSDNLGVGTGTTDPNSRLQIKKDGTGNYANQTFSNANSTAGITFGIAGSGTGNYLANNAFLLNTGASAFIFGTNDTERMRIDSDGNLLLGTTTRINNSNTIAKTTDHVPLNLRRDNGASDNSILICVKSSNTAVLAIRGDGDLENTNNAYGALSDERLKSNIVDANSQLEDIKKVKVRNYTLDSTGETHIGVIAQELEESGMGGLVVKREEGYKGVKYSILFMKAIKAIQELTAKVEELESKIDG